MEVSPEELHELMQRPGPRAFHLVDVRESDDFLYSRLLWAEFMPLSRLQTEAPKRIEDKKAPVVVYCRDGAMSQRAGELLRSLGYEFVFRLTGGLEAWKKQVEPTFPLENHSAPHAVSAAPGSPASLRPPMPTPPKPSSAHLPTSVSHGEISPEELRTYMDQPAPRDFRLVDVREEDEFQICRLDWAELIPLAEIPEQAPRRLVDKDRPIVVYCHHGMRSQHACEWLRRAGYEHVFNLTGGIDAWADRIEPTMRRY